MKYKRLAVFIENKSGSFYQVALSQTEMDMVVDLIVQMQDGSIKIRNERYDELSFGEDAKT
jgi:hypothetical protein